MSVDHEVLRVVPVLRRVEHLVPVGLRAGDAAAETEATLEALIGLTREKKN